MTYGFSVQSVEIEGFKGFTSPNCIEFKGRHVFLLGRNGNGKSSIVEAVRWGLFGSAFRPNEVIKNQHYSGDCRVTIQLMRDGEPWTLRRILNLGANRTSDPVLTDHLGNRRPIREIMPQLASVEAGEGAHIIFAPQSAPLKRQPEDLDPFEQTVFNYLGLTHPRALLSNIHEFLEDQAAIEHDLDDQLIRARTDIDDQIQEEQTRRNNILNSPPWGDSIPPSIAESERKARRFIEDVRAVATDGFEGFSLEALLDTAEESLDKKREEGRDSLERDATEFAGRRGNLESLRDTQNEIASQKESIGSTKLDLDSILDGETIDELHEQLESAKYRLETDSIKELIVRHAITLLARDDSDNVSCPICHTKCDRREMDMALVNGLALDDAEEHDEISDLEFRIQRYKELIFSLDEQESKLSSLTQSEDKSINSLSDEDKADMTDSPVVEQLIDKYLKKEDAVKAQIENQDEWFRSKSSQLDRLREESRFHTIQKHFNDLEAERRELERVIEAFNNLVMFGQSVRRIREVVENCLNAQLAREIPRVSEILSNAFNMLTQHTWYDRLIISETPLPKLELRVASSQDPFQREDPTGVLNGQAESALSLVPYFAFSQTDDTPTEVYLVMLDDPTRALDTEHIKILVERLRELGRNVQLIVASQETERFHRMLPEVFDEDSYVIIEPHGWSPDTGPNLKIQHG